VGAARWTKIRRSVAGRPPTRGPRGQSRERVRHVNGPYYDWGLFLRRHLDRRADTLRWWSSAIAVLVLLSMLLTWPQVRFLGSRVADHNDPFLSMWRLSWLAHALRTDAQHLFDGNILYPEKLTLAYSDATFLEGALAAPLLWAGLNRVAVYNLLLLSGIASSGIGMFALVRRLTANEGAALVAGAIFTLAPYRIEHFMHLELQWTAWIPLSLWAVHKALDDRSFGAGLLAGVLIWLQFLSCIYYGIFLVILIALVAPLLLATASRNDARAAAVRSRPGALRGVMGLIGGAALLGALSSYYAQPYLQASRTVGVRGIDDIRPYSATPRSYTAAPPQNWLWGWTANVDHANELRLFPGLVGVALAVCAAARRPRRLTWVYLVAVALAVELSFGWNGRLYPWLHARLWVLHGLRAPARCGIVAVAALSVLAGLGFDVLHWCLAQRGRRLLLVLTMAAVAVEGGSAPMMLTAVPAQVPDVYRYLATLGPAVVAELPMAEPGWMPGNDPIYMYWSTAHWNPLVNGYSGYASREYVETLSQMLGFPDDLSLRRLRSLDVRYIVIHEGLYTHDTCSSLLSRIGAIPALVPVGRFRDFAGQARIFELADHHGMRN
jgi:hypothetical protein